MKYSRKEITKAGVLLLTSNFENEKNIALNKINDWRTNHVEPLKVMKRRLVRLINNNSISPILISQRLKRLTSIENKLILNPKMGLGGMQDVGGYRAVLKDVKDLNRLKTLLENTSNYHRFEKNNDYVNTPKNSGYRSIHYIYKYSSKIIEYDQLRVELQIRTKLQHNWATAVETAGLITKTSLKSSQGPDEWLYFFKVVSSLFAFKEKLPVLEEFKKKSMEDLMVECYNLCNKLNVIVTLKALGVTTEHLEKQKFPGDYYLIFIDIEKRVVSLNVFNKSTLDQATQRYLEIEKEIDDSKSAVVLVSATSFKDLKKAYPSYFLDTTEFLNALEKINSNCKKLNLL